MANSSGTTEVANTPSKEQDANANGQVEATEEEGANGQLPDSTSSQNRASYIQEQQLTTMDRHLPNQDQAAPRAL
jgi:hypothetical protein